MGFYSDPKLGSHIISDWMLKNWVKPLSRNLQAIKKKYEESQSEIEKLKVSAAEQKLKIDVLEAEKLR